MHNVPQLPAVLQAFARQGREEAAWHLPWPGAFAQGLKLHPERCGACLGVHRVIMRCHERAVIV